MNNSVINLLILTTALVTISSINKKTNKRSHKRCYLPYTLIKFSSSNCGICNIMSKYDSKIVSDLGINFVDVSLQNGNLFEKHKKFLLKVNTNKGTIRVPRYILVRDINDENSIINDIEGGLKEESFEKKILEFINE